MTTDSNLNEIRKKIYKLRTAIMYSLSDEVIKLPNCLVTAIRVDDEGQLWFVCQNPFQHKLEYERSFPVRLHFYQKGVFFHIEISGKATIIDDDYSGQKPEKETAGDEKIMFVKMTMSSIEYTEPDGKKEKSGVELLFEKGYKWMLRHIAYPHSKPAFLKNTA